MRMGLSRCEVRAAVLVVVVGAPRPCASFPRPVPGRHPGRAVSSSHSKLPSPRQPPSFPQSLTPPLQPGQATASRPRGHPLQTSRFGQTGAVVGVPCRPAPRTPEAQAGGSWEEQP